MKNNELLKKYAGISTRIRRITSTIHGLNR